ncbi:hypothetical protein [Geodermatophilus sp. URMC 62]|uniref:hypothetical protein n=1 Tax=Geodermatophilus sp. URMC 62 TaxID=3423414 RepID=UPI00406D37B0
MTAAEVRVLVDQQFPARRDLPVRPLPQSGTDNALFGLGTRLVARVPLVPDDVEPLRRLWARLCTLPPSRGGNVMTHGDLIPGNVLVAGDLLAAWHLFDVGPRQAPRADLGSGDLQWARGAAWALQQALGVGWYYVDSNPAMSSMGLRTLDRLVAHPPAMP